MALWSVNLVSGVVMVPDNFPRSIDYYKRNVSALMEKLGKEFSAETQVVWLTSPPVAVEVRSGFLVEGMEALAPSMRFNIVEGNQMAAHVVASHGGDVLDLHYWMAHHIHRRVGDGIHCRLLITAHRPRVVFVSSATLAPSGKFTWVLSISSRPIGEINPYRPRGDTINGVILRSLVIVSKRSSSRGQRDLASLPVRCVVAPRVCDPQASLALLVARRHVAVTCLLFIERSCISRASIPFWLHDVLFDVITFVARREHLATRHFQNG